jgi:tRNA nucleotidyltransferase (CCA-adding enzyme)
MVKNKDLETLPKERIFEEIKKLLLLSQKPSIGLEILDHIDALEFFEPLHLYKSTQQDSTSHPEGSLWIHTLMCIDTMASLRTGEGKKDLLLMLAALLHDCGKPFTTIIENGCLNAPGHAVAGIPIAQKFIEKLSNDKQLLKEILPLIRHHGTPRKFFKINAPDNAILKLSAETVIEDLLLIAEADFFGRTFTTQIPEIFEAGQWLHTQAKRLGVLHSPPAPLLQGQDLIDLGLQPSKQFKTILDSIYEAQLECQIRTKEEALEWAKTEIGKISVTNP